MLLDRLDYLVLTVANINATLAFYTRVLGMQEITFGDQRKALVFGRQKITCIRSCIDSAKLILIRPAPNRPWICSTHSKN